MIQSVPARILPEGALAPVTPVAAQKGEAVFAEIFSALLSEASTAPQPDTPDAPDDLSDRNAPDLAALLSSLPDDVARHLAAVLATDGQGQAELIDRVLQILSHDPGKSHPAVLGRTPDASEAAPLSQYASQQGAFGMVAAAASLPVTPSDTPIPHPRLTDAIGSARPGPAHSPRPMLQEPRPASASVAELLPPRSGTTPPTAPEPTGTIGKADMGASVQTAMPTLAPETSRIDPRLLAHSQSRTILPIHAADIAPQTAAADRGTTDPPLDGRAAAQNQSPVRPPNLPGTLPRPPMPAVAVTPPWSATTARDQAAPTTIQSSSERQVPPAGPQPAFAIAPQTQVAIQLPPHFHRVPPTPPPASAVTTVPAPETPPRVTPQNLQSPATTPGNDFMPMPVRITSPYLARSRTHVVAPSRTVPPMITGTDAATAATGSNRSDAPLAALGSSDPGQIVPATPNPMIGTVGHGPASGSTLTRHIAQQLATAAPHARDRPVELVLNPEELGRVRFMLVQGEGVITVSLQAERGDTLDLLRRHIAQLENEFQDLGFSDIRFSFGTASQDGRHPQASPDREDATTLGFNHAPDEPGIDTDTIASHLTSTRDTGSLDLRL
ncbi:flagellar hook-length control protein FliK [Marimonas arenosa]|uniref:Flagellar hook-length control protein FliK n=1 Tax=Marimonas arenosa TaxID=1795305 RepID=A0AAE4B6L1_9RHOB|nr:flagellar hook-length control protein FliK [Marimonas arenosa]MDQ2090546.1 flagellar hook-length control protein FliK [Marimonas arenosa]